MSPSLSPPRHSRSSTSPSPSLSTRSTPTNDDIEAVIKMATSSLPSLDRPLRDTRTQLFVGNLPYRVRWQDLKDLFRRAGTVLRADVSLGPDNRSRGYGTVLLATAEDAGRAIDMFNGYCWQTRVLEVRPDRLGATLDADSNINPPFPNPSLPFVQALNLPVLSALNGLDDLAAAGNGELLSGGTGMRTLFVGNLPFHIQWQDLKDLFRAAGAVTRADVALGTDGRSRGFGTVTFVTEDGAERARRMFEGYEFNGRPLKVHYDKFAQSCQNIPLVGPSPQAVSTSLLPPYDSYPQLTSPLSRLEVLSAHDGRSHSYLDALAQSQLHLDLQRSRLEAEGLTSAQLDALLTRPRSSSFTSPSLTPPAVLSQSPSHLQSPALLQPQSQALSGSSLGASIPQPILSSSAHSLSQPHSLTGSPLSISAKVSSSGSSVHSFGTRDPLGSATDLALVTDLSDIKLTPDSFTSHATNFGSPRPSLSATSSQTSSFSSSGSRRLNLSAASSRADVLSDGASLGFGSQRTSFSSSTRPSFGAASAEKPSFTISTSERLSFGASSERTPFGAGSSSQRPSMSSTSSQNPSLATSSQRSAAHLTAPLLEDDGPTPSSSAHLSATGASKPPSLAPVAMSLGLPASKSGSHLGSAGPSSKIGSPPPLNSGSISNNLSELSRIGSPENRGAQASPSHIPPRSTSERTPPEVSLSAQSILSTDASPAPDTTWGASKPQLRKDSPTSKANGTVDYVTTALGTLGMRRANRVQSKQTEEKRKSSMPSGDQQSQAASSAAPQSHGKRSTQSSSHRHPGPISLPPPTAFTLPPGVVLSPHAHPQSPVYHPGYPLSPVHPHPMGSPLHHPMGSPLHHPVHMHSPLHHPGHPQYGTYPHHATSVHYGVITPHGLPPITPSMPPFTFLPPQAKTPTQNGHAHEDKGSNERCQYASQNEGRQIDPPKRESTAQVSQPPYYAQFPNAPQQRMQYTQIHPHMFSPGIQLSPGIMIPLSPGIVPPAVSMSVTGVPVPMTPGVALTPGVTMTPGAFWPHAPWMNPVVGAPVHGADGLNEQSHTGAEGYFPPVSQPSGDTGYFPPVSSVAKDILKEGHVFASGSGVSCEENAHHESVLENSPRSPSPDVSQVSSLDPSQKSPQDVNRKGGPQIMKRSTSAQCEGGLPKRNGLLHRESDPEVSTTTHKGSKEA
ncbi:hypothetical protein J3R83DRAFT_4932 [Lanmaoa asiatica]|nr:hypothetical protein J3R83DRAFT_4932 [Lanmaoa asiatica]